MTTQVKDLKVFSLEVAKEAAKVITDEFNFTVMIDYLSIFPSEANPNFDLYCAWFATLNSTHYKQFYVYTDGKDLIVKGLNVINSTAVIPLGDPSCFKKAVEKLKAIGVRRLEDKKHDVEKLPKWAMELVYSLMRDAHSEVCPVCGYTKQKDLVCYCGVDASDSKEIYNPKNMFNLEVYG